MSAYPEREGFEYALRRNSGIVLMERKHNMTELEKVMRAKMYIDKLAEGINPIDDSYVADEDVINNVRISRCLFYVADVLQQVIDNGGEPKKETRHRKTSFCLTDEQKEELVVSEIPLCISEIVKDMNEVADRDNCKRLTVRQAVNWLIHTGMLEMVTDESGKTRKVPTERGKEIGITEQVCDGMYGEYHVLLYDSSAQQYIIDNIESIVAHNEMYVKPMPDNCGAAWTKTQDQLLTDLFQQNNSIRQIADIMKRTAGGIRSRLKMLGLIEVNEPD